MDISIMKKEDMVIDAQENYLIPGYLKTPDIAMFNRLQEAAHGLVKLITIAPETEGAEGR